MKDQSGWGLKTSALLTKAVYLLYNGEHPDELRFWDDAPRILNNGDELYLPVDRVIIQIFTRLEPEKWDFNRINKKIESFYTGKEIEVWDDLWFWGFITQHGSGNDRKIAWNPNKYWILKESNKEPQVILEIEKKANQFVSIIY